MLETERKYLIEYPDTEMLISSTDCTVGEITQTYLISSDGTTRRVRRTVSDGRAVYQKNTKTRISAITRIEDECEISRQEYEDLIQSERDMSLNVIYKTRYTFYYLGQKFEVDVYPFWTKSAICETELDNEDAKVEFPSFVRVKKEVTEDRRYSNKAMAKVLPPE